MNDAYAHAVEYYLAGNLQKSSILCQKLLQKNQKDDKTLNLFGLIQGVMGKKAQAINFLEKAVKANPKNVEAITNLANAYNAESMLDKAIEMYELAIKINPNFSKSYYNAGILLREHKNYMQAKEMFQKAILLDDKFVDSYTNLAAVFKDEGDLEQAIQTLEKAPEGSVSLSALALLISEKKQHDRAISLMNRAIELNSNHEMLNNLGIILSNAKMYNESIMAYLQAISLKNDFDTAYSNLANSLIESGDEQKAKGALLKAISINPNAASHYVNLGVYLKKVGEFSACEEAFIKALELEPQNRPAATNLAILYLYFGRYKDGLALYERREKPFIRTNKPYWQGEPLDGKRLFVYHEQGFGDTLNFARLLFDDLLAGQDVVFLPQKELYELFANSSLPSRVLSSDEVLSGNLEFDYHISLMSLMNLLAVTEKKIPNNIAYINIDNEKKNTFMHKLAGLDGKKIGIVWQGNKDYSGDKERSVALSQFQPFLEAGYNLVSLQKELNDDSLDFFNSHSKTLEITNELMDFSDTAALISTLDCVVSVDTSVAHLAGVLDVPTFILLPLVADWRWGVSGKDGKWYSSVKLCRRVNMEDVESALIDALNGVKELLG